MATQWMMEVAQTFYNRKPYQSLAPTEIWDHQLDERIQNATNEQLIGERTAREEDITALRSGLHLWNDSLTLSHTLAQDVENQTGSYWHGIMHRMEPDYSNSKYWFRLTGKHPVFPLLQQKFVEFVRQHEGEYASSRIWAGLEKMAEKSEWDPFTFIDLVEMAAGEPHDAAVEALQQIQRFEMLLLLNDTHERCGGGKLFASI